MKKSKVRTRTRGKVIGEVADKNFFNSTGFNGEG